MRPTASAPSLAILLAACALSTAACTPGGSSAGSTASPSVSPVPPRAAGLFVTGSGSITCRVPFPSGCAAYFLIRPASWDGQWKPGQSDPVFDARSELGSGEDYLTPALTGELVGGPDTISAGHYRVAGARADISDVIGDPPWPIVLCTADLTVEPETTHVYVGVAFENDGCQIRVSQDSVPPIPSGTPSPLPD